jgi:hypothetical protein
MLLISAKKVGIYGWKYITKATAVKAVQMNAGLRKTGMAGEFFRGSQHRKRFLSAHI